MLIHTKRHYHLEEFVFVRFHFSSTTPPHQRKNSGMGMRGKKESQFEAPNPLASSASSAASAASARAGEKTGAAGAGAGGGGAAGGGSEKEKKKAWFLKKFVSSKK